MSRIHIDIPTWDLTRGESERDFRRRANQECKRAIEGHIQRIEAEGWTDRRKLAAVYYIDGLALWQCGFSLEQIRLRLGEKGVHVGGKLDHTGIRYGVDAVASYIGLDRRRPKRSADN